MPRDQDTITIPKDGAYHLLSDGAVASIISFQVLAGHVEIRMGGAQPPAEELRGQSYQYPFGERGVAATALAAAGGDHVWARAIGGIAFVWVDHA